MGIGVADLSKHFGAVVAIGGVSFEIADGEFVSLLGPSGCGKTTTLRCIAGLEDATGGEVRIGDHLVSAPAHGILVPAHERRIGMVFQSYAVWPHMTVQENVGFPLSVRAVKAAEATGEVEEALRIVGLSALATRYPAQLSGGQQQRVALARAIVGRPQVLLFDEPLSNLDAKLREGMRSEIRALQRRLGIAAVYVTHDREEALSMSDRVIVMDQGRIVQIGTPQDLYRRPASRFVADFVGKVSFVELSRNASGGWSCPDGTVLATGSGEARGAQALAAIRPEAIRLDPAIAPPPEAGPNCFLGTIAEAQYMGPHTEYMVEAVGTVLRAYAPVDLAPGTRVAVIVPAAQVVVLPRD